MEKTKRKYINTNTEAKNHAQFLIIYKGLTNKETAKRLGVNEKSIAAWIKKYGWKEQAESKLYETKRADSLHVFLTFASNMHPAMYPVIEQVYNDYIKNF